MNLKGLVSKKRIINALYKEVISKYGGVYSDDAWQNVFKLIDEITESVKDIDPSASIDFTQSGTYHIVPNEMPYRDYKFTISVLGYEIGGSLTCSSAGTVEDPWSRYDMAVVLW